MTTLPIPSLLVINTTTNHHHIPEDETEKLTPYVIELFLEQIRNESAPVRRIKIHVRRLFDLLKEYVNKYLYIFSDTVGTIGWYVVIENGSK